MVVTLRALIDRLRTARSDRLFLLLLVAGFAVRLAIVLLVVPDVDSVWFVPFFQHFWAHPSLDPWQSFLDSGGTPEAFPYGAPMFVYFAFWTGITAWLPAPWAFQLGMGLGLLGMDAAVCLTLARFTRSPQASAAVFVLSPVVVYATYVHGQLDIVPTALMLGGGLALGKRRWQLAGVLGGLAIAAKFSSALVPPLVLIFLLRNARWRPNVGAYLLGLLPGLAIAVLPALLPGYRVMVFGTPTLLSVFAYSVDLGPGLVIVVLPVVYAGILGLQYRMTRSNPDLLQMLIGIALTATTLLTPASPGWYVWAVPFLAILAVESGIRVVLVVWGFWAVATVSLSVRSSGATWRGGPRADPVDFDATGLLNPSGSLGAVLATATVAVGVVGLIMIYRGFRWRFDIYRLSGSPLSVAISGDSGTGKDTLCVSLASVFGEEATAFLMGDDYHHYERGAPIWKNTTHLHPAANDLSTMTRDALSLMRGKGVVSKHYDHGRGRFTKQRPIRHRELVVINGLHALTSAEVRRVADLTVFTSMDERLRRQLKINRDVGERQQSLETVVASMDRRVLHAERYVDPQADLADIVFRIEPVRPLPDIDQVLPGHIELKLVAHLRDFSFAERLQRELIAVAGCASSIEYLEEPGVLRLSVYPEQLESADTKALASTLIIRKAELFVGGAEWLDRSRGIMQLVVVLAILERRRNRWETTR